MAEGGCRTALFPSLGQPLMLMALALLSLPPASTLPLRSHAGLFTLPSELWKSSESRAFQNGKSIRLERSISSRRPLQWRAEDENNEVEEDSSISESALTAPRVSPPPHHRRHQKSLAGGWSGRGKDSQGYDPAPALNASPQSPTANTPSPPSASSSSPSPAPPSPSGPRRRLRAHEACYSSNEVLLVIGVTCAVNFAFILLVVSLVHLCNRGASKVVLASTECEWAAAEELQHGVRRWPWDDAMAAGAGGAYERVQEYVDSLPDPQAPAFFEEHDETLATNVAVATSARQPSRRRPAPYGLRGACSMEELLFLN